MSVISLSGFIALITSFVGLLPQIYKSFKTKSTQDLSILMLGNYFLCSSAWIIYGSSTNSSFVLVSNVVGLVSCIILIMQKYYYDAS